MPPKFKKSYPLILAHISKKYMELGIGLLLTLGLTTFEEKNRGSWVKLIIQIPSKFSKKNWVSLIRKQEIEFIGFKVFTTLKLSRESGDSWASNYQKFLKPFLMPGPRKNPQKSRIRIDPGEIKIKTPIPDTLRIKANLAFGTGKHASTQLAAILLQEYLADNSPPINVLDVGCGSGILSMIALKAGATRVVGVDNDPQALKVARENLKINRISPITLRSGLPPPAAKFDLIVANINPPTLINLRPSLNRHLKKDGALILSGFLNQDVKPLLHAFKKWQLADRVNKSGWAALLLRK